MAEFRLHDRLLADCHRLGRMTHCHVLLHRAADLPWFILVPETDVPDLLDLPDRVRDDVLGEAAGVARFIKQTLGWPKVNFGAIGNLVPQLHLHVVGRRPGDACWPSPVWGNLQPSAEYSEDALREITDVLVGECGLNEQRTG